MDMIWESITEWLKEVLVGGIISNLTGMFDSTNQQVSQIVGEVTTRVFSWKSWNAWAKCPCRPTSRQNLLIRNVIRQSIPGR